MLSIDNNNIIISRHTMIITTENFSTGCFEHYFSVYFGTKKRIGCWIYDDDDDDDDCAT